MPTSLNPECCSPPPMPMPNTIPAVKNRSQLSGKRFYRQNCVRRFELRQPEARREGQINRVVRILTAVVLLSLVLGGGLGFFRKARKKRLNHRHSAESALIRTQEYPAVDLPEAEPGLRLLEGLKQHLGLRRRLQIVQFFRWLLFWFLWPFSGPLAWPTASIPFPRPEGLPAT